ncbi:hypothetical protein Tco_0474778 [Tanacetum coccineum]
MSMSVQKSHKFTRWQNLQDGEKILCLVDDLNVLKIIYSHTSQDKGTSSSLKSMITAPYSQENEKEKKYASTRLKTQHSMLELAVVTEFAVGTELAVSELAVLVFTELAATELAVLVFTELAAIELSVLVFTELAATELVVLVFIELADTELAVLVFTELTATELVVLVFTELAATELAVLVFTELAATELAVLVFTELADTELAVLEFTEFTELQVSLNSQYVRFLEKQKSNDEEAVMLSASRATSTVVDAANATEVSRNHSGSVDEILKIRNPRQIKRLAWNEFEKSNDEEAVVLSASRATSTVVDATNATNVSTLRLGFVFVYFELAKTAGLEEFEKSNDKEAVVLSASRATSPVVDATNATEVSRNHSGSVDEISNIRNPRKMKRLRSSSSQIANTWQSIALRSTFTRRGLSAIVNNLLQSGMSLEEFLLAKGISSEKTVEIEYIRAVAPHKEENPSLHDDWVSAVDGLSQ